MKPWRAAGRKAATQTLALSPPVQLVALAQPPSATELFESYLHDHCRDRLLSGIVGVALALASLARSTNEFIFHPDLVEQLHAFHTREQCRRNAAALSRRWFEASAPSVGYLRAIDAVRHRNVA